MSHDHRSSHYSHRDGQHHRRAPQRRNVDREVVQSDELSSTSGARMISNEDLYNARRNPHLSSTSLPAISAAGAPHPKSPAARAQQRSAQAQNQAPFHSENNNAAYTGGIPRIENTPANRTGSLPRTERPPANRTGGIPRTGTSANRTDGIPRADRTGGFRAIEEPSASSSHRTDSHAAVADVSMPQTQATGATVAIPEEAHASAQSYQDYTAASGRYKAHATPGNTAGFKPLHASTQHTRRRKKSWPRIVAAIAIVLAVGVGGYFGINQLLYAGPITATVNGETMTLEGNERSIEGLLDNNIVSVTPGNYVAVDNSVMREGEGTRATALINENEVSDLKAHINEGDQVVVSNGTDVMEAYTDSAPTVIPAGYSKTGAWGALHVFLPGQDGEVVTRTGSESGKTVDQTTKEKIDDRLVYYNANSNGEKVVALTFDDGPWGTTTDQILDILKENGAKATFYTIGQQIPEHADQIKRMAADGHEIATHTWDHADGSGKGVSLDLMSTDERKQEVEKGLAVIKETTGKDASVYFRAPGGNFGEATANDLKALVEGEIGWNVDTEDWRRPGAEVIAERIKSVQPGGVILMHDGGGDRSQTVAGLREGLAYLKSQGYKFVTISELIESYPYQEGQQV